MHRHDQWLYYILGALLTLVWKWQRYAYSMKGIQTANPDGTLNPPIKFWQASKKWSYGSWALCSSTASALIGCSAAF
jgi:hypothetical protein